MAEKRQEKLVNQLQSALAEVQTLSEIWQTVNRSLDLDQILNDVLDRVIELFKLHSGSIRLLDPQTQEMVLIAQRGLAAEDFNKLPKRRKLGESLTSFSFSTNKVLVIEDVLTDPRIASRKGFAKEIGIRGVAVIPLFVKDKLLGNMAIRSVEPRAYSAEELRLLVSIGHLIGSAIENARL
ncbi:MAG: GAF domain-containing protein, partial [Desulfobacterales bacterium]|nr:GAF domain-containing protein [Desulfobacterales bacterium]